MHYILQVDFPYHGPWGEDMVPAMQGLAQSIAKEAGLIWKIWTENKEGNEAGGIYLFADLANAERYVALHSAHLKQAGIPQVNAKIFAVNEALSHIDGWRL